MALNSDFKVKNSLYVSNSAFFGGTATSIDTTGAILSAGTDLFDIFSTPDIADLTSGACIASFSYDGQSVATVAICSDAYNKWDNTYTTVNSISGNAVCDISAPATQGGVTATDRAGVADTITIHNLAIGDSPTFAGLCSTGGLSATGNILVGGTVDGVDIATRDAVLTTTTVIANAALPLSGGTMSGAIAMGACKITNLSNPTADQDAATKCYVDSVGSGLVDSVTAGNGTICVDNTDPANPTVEIPDACVTALSGAFCTAGSSTQGNIGLTRLNGGTCTLDIGLCNTDDVVFNSLSSTGNILVGGQVGLGTSSPTSTYKLDVVGGIKVSQFIDVENQYGLRIKDTGGVTACAVTLNSSNELTIGHTSNTIPTRIIGDYITLEATNFLGVPAEAVRVIDGGCVGIGTTTPSTKLHVAGDSLVTGDSTIYGNLSVTGDFTCIETTISTTSALSVTNTGTGPALFVCQTGVQPIAHFIDKEGCDIVFNNDGYVGIGTFSPACRLTVSGGISANGTLQIDGATTLNSTVTLGGVSAGAGNENTVVVKCGSGLLVTDVIDGKVWGTALVDGEGSDNSLPKYTNSTGTIGDSNITDDGTTITLNGNVTYGNGATVKQPSAGGTVSTEDKVFVGTVGTSATSVTTFTKSGLNSVKYEVTLQKGVNITTFEVHAAYNGTAPFGTVYAIVDAQAASQLVEVEIASTGSTIDLDITAAAVGTTATIYGKAKY